ncbi:hypothetical protein CBOM_08110 [Ceraceosorus bombacis]|uniref:Uncharacterized protein n=1 Tax=Ceraceosorus bombacis TaxID=401625 RepID=A0A0P1BBE7_9BASI|nr:hypothetical protein CBOM_08110 [Ceraceosorus bombacis]
MSQVRWLAGERAPGEQLSSIERKQDPLLFARDAKSAPSSHTRAMVSSACIAKSARQSNGESELLFYQDKIRPAQL